MDNTIIGNIKRKNNFINHNLEIKKLIYIKFRDIIIREDNRIQIIDHINKENKVIFKNKVEKII